MSESTLNEITEHAKNTRVHKNAVVLANIIELACACVKRVSCGEAAQALEGGEMNRDVLANIVANRVKEKLIA